VKLCQIYWIYFQARRAPPQLKMLLARRVAEVKLGSPS
jgi:hypothetical protein